jgi:hypothetical protein
MGTRRRIIHENYERFHYKGIEGPHACSATKTNLLHERNGPGFFTSREEGEDFTLKEGRQGGTGASVV